MSKANDVLDEILNSEWYQQCKNCQFWYSEFMQCMYEDDMREWKREKHMFIPARFLFVPCKINKHFTDNTDQKEK